MGAVRCLFRIGNVGVPHTAVRWVTVECFRIRVLQEGSRRLDPIFAT